MSGINFKNTGWAHNQLTTGGAGSGGQGRRNFYMATPEGAKETIDPELSDTGIIPVTSHQPLSFNQIEQVDLNRLLENKTSNVVDEKINGA